MRLNGVQRVRMKFSSKMVEAIDELYPLVFTSENVPRPWGGEHLGKPINGLPIGERWLLSTLYGHESAIRNGILAGQTLFQIIGEYPTALLGGKTPINAVPLVKWIDTRHPLSVQVHPDDTFAQEQGLSNGKSEMWYILNSVEGATLYAGFKSLNSVASMRSAIEQGTVVEELHAYYPQRDEVYFIPGGVVHAIGGGIQLLEIQQPSDTTYRLFDWGRTDSKGQRRELHVDLGCSATHILQQAIIRKATDGVAYGKRELITTSPLYLAQYTLTEGKELKRECKGVFRTYLSTTASFMVHWYSPKGVLSSMLIGPMEVVLIPACIGAHTLTAHKTAVTLLEFAISGE